MKTKTSLRLLTDIHGDSPGNGNKEKQGKGTAFVAVQGSGNKNNSGQTEKINVKNQINNFIQGNPSNAVVTGLPAPSTPVTGKSSGFPARNAVVGLNYTVDNTQVTFDGEAAPDKFKVNNNDAGTYPVVDGGAGQPTPPFLIKGDINAITVKGTVDNNATTTPATGDSWDLPGATATINYTYQYTQWPVSQPANIGEVNAFNKGIPTRPMIPDATSLTGYRVQTGYQDAPPGVPGAKPLLQHGIGYIVKFLIGGYNAVDKSK